MTNSRNPRSASTAAHPARRQWLTTALPLLGAGVAVALLPGLSRAATNTPTPLEVWKDPNCGCCQDWVDHMQANGFAVKALRTRAFVPRSRCRLWSRTA